MFFYVMCSLIKFLFMGFVFSPWLLLWICVLCDPSKRVCHFLHREKAGCRRCQRAGIQQSYLQRAREPKFSC